MTTDFTAYSIAVLRWYGSGFTLQPPFALLGFALGCWLQFRRGPVIWMAGGMAGTMFGALVAVCWHYHAVLSPQLDLVSLALATGSLIVRPLLTGFSSGKPDEFVLAAIYYAPILFAGLLDVLVTRYDEALSEMWSRFRERLAERRAARAEKMAQSHNLRGAAASLPETFYNTVSEAPEGDVPATTSDVPVIETRPGEPVTVTPGRAGGRVVIVVKFPPPAFPRLGQGWLSGFFVGTYYAVATVQKAWLPLALVGLWLFWAPLTSYAQQRVVDASASVAAQVARQIKLW